MQNQNDPSMLTNDQKMWAMFSHFGFIIGGFLTPLIIWQVKKEESPFIVENAKNALNWSLTLLIIMIPLGLLMGIGMVVAGDGALIVMGLFYLVIFIFAIINIVVSLMSGLKANKGEVGTYPFSIRFVK